jgi:metallo-beta-lactamase family protein
MCNGGRILHHLFHRLPRNNDTVLFVGYQAEGTRGRKIVEGDKKIKILGEEVDVNCNIVNIGGLSAHADKNELFKWMSNFKDAPKNTFIIHGEPETQHIFADNIKSKLGWNTYVPEHLETYELFKGI